MTTFAKSVLTVASAIGTACATAGGRTADTDLDPTVPQTVDGDPQALAWPFELAPGLAGLRLRLDSGGALLAVRPDAANPDPSAPGWTGSLRGAEAAWSGPASRDRRILLAILVRAPGAGDQELHVRWASLRAPAAETEWICERWIYRIAEKRVSRAGC